MVEADTIKLLRECNAGVKMGVSSIDEVLPKIKNEKMKKILLDNKLKHEDLGGRTSQILLDYSDDGKEPNIMAKGMSWMKTNIMVGMADDTDKAIAKLMTEGCNMGINSLCEYLNKYQAAEEKVKDLTKELVSLEEDLAHSLREFL